MARFLVFVVLAVLGFITIVAASFGSVGWWVLAAVVVALLVIGIWDVVQTRHSILRNYPILGHMRYVLESIRPEIQQYFVERNVDGKPFNRDVRSLVYARSGK